MSSRKDAKPVSVRPVAMAGRSTVSWSLSCLVSVGEDLFGQVVREGLPACLASEAGGPPGGWFLVVPGWENTPLSNTGCFVSLREGEVRCEKGDVGNPLLRAASRVAFHIDYLKVTVWADSDNVVMILSEFCEENLGFVPVFEPIECIGKRICQDKRSGLKVTMDEPTPGQAGCWTWVELTGEDGCAKWGDARLRELLMFLGENGKRWRACRVDAAWDHVGFDPAWMDRQIRLGNFVSRSLDQDHRKWENNALGDTCYLGLRLHHKPRIFRCYNKRGFVRFEMETHGDWAEKMGDLLADNRVSEWSRLAMGVVLGGVDFRVGGLKSRQTDRCVRLPEWAELVGQAEKMALGKVVEMPKDKSRIEKAKQFIVTYVKQLAVITEGAGLEWFGEQVRAAVQERCAGMDVAAAEEFLGEMSVEASKLRGQVHEQSADGVPF